MNKLQATVKVPPSEAERVKNELHALGAKDILLRDVPYERFVRESRMNYDCVFRQIWEEKSGAVYLEFCFEDSDAGRAAAYDVEFNLKQIPLNLCYVGAEPEWK